ncbi:MAG: S8 family serine peptidase [Devosia nanyangense]|uniref:S8 family serine peptidase n=1 Tax=Devosia nanyangense TaxID=1228055 RepID=A0A933L5V2_9HYPH|nr:S8 family serine peptidase [Devosia nanyangense]
MAAIPYYMVEYFLLGRTRSSALDQFLMDGGVVAEVWLTFAKDPGVPQRLLLGPVDGVRAIDLGSALNEFVLAYRRQIEDKKRPLPGVSLLENFVAARIQFDELVRVVLPSTKWWHDRQLSDLSGRRTPARTRLADGLHRVIQIRLGAGHESGIADARQSVRKVDKAQRRILDAAPVAALIGLFGLVDEDPAVLQGMQTLDPRVPADDMVFMAWAREHAKRIADHALAALTRPLEAPPLLVQRVFRDRELQLADIEANRTVKADAAQRLFEISCRTLTWAIIDSGVAATHPAFVDHQPGPAPAKTKGPQSRVRRTYDFTLMDQIRNFDLASAEPDSEERKTRIEATIDKLAELPGRKDTPAFRKASRIALGDIAMHLKARVKPDWSVIEPLIRLDDDGLSTAALVTDHGTHVAGILAADWREVDKGKENVVLLGMCPDINIYDLRVLHQTSPESTESAILAALEFIQYVNGRAVGTGPVIHGANISLSIPHDVRNYGCGATPICVASDRLVNAGVVVVAAAGNRGWNEQEMGFGNFVFCSITDPGNARDVITVGSTHRLMPHVYGVSYFSSRGPTGDGRIKPDLVAPGEKIRSAVRGDADDEFAGTSMASPVVCGAAAMLMARNRELIGNTAEIKRILLSTATDLGREKYFQGHGLLDVLRALQSV